MAKTLSCDYNFNESNFDMVSPIAKVKMKLMYAKCILMFFEYVGFYFKTSCA